MGDKEVVENLLQVLVSSYKVCWTSVYMLKYCVIEEVVIMLQ